MDKDSKLKKTTGKKLKSLQITTIDLTAYCFLRTWFQYLTDRGFDVTLATTVAEFREEIEKTGANVVHIPIARNVNPVRDFISLINLYKYIKKEKFDSVQTYTTKAGFIGRLAARLAGVPVIIHNILELPQNSVQNSVLKFIYKTMEQVAAKWADFIITTTNPNRNQILENHIVPPEKLAAIPEGIELKNYETVKADPLQKRKELGIPDGAVFIGTVARLEAAKGHKYLLEAAKQILEKRKDIYFIMVGKGHLQAELEEKTKELGIQANVRFLGFRDDMLEILQSVDLFVLPSLWEGQGVVLMEAMCYKKPVIACKVGGVVDIVQDGENGLLVPSRDPDSLAKAILKMMDMPEKMKEMGEEGYRRIASKFRDSEMNDRRFEVYGKLFKEKLNVELPSRIKLNEHIFEDKIKMGEFLEGYHILETWEKQLKDGFLHRWHKVIRKTDSSLMVLHEAPQKEKKISLREKSIDDFLFRFSRDKDLLRNQLNDIGISGKAVEGIMEHINDIVIPSNGMIY